MVESQSDNHRDRDTAVNHSVKGGIVDAAEGVSGSNGESRVKETIAGKAGGLSVEEHLERLASLNLNSGRISRTRFSPAIIRMLSAAAGVAALLLIYFCFKLFI